MKSIIYNLTEYKDRKLKTFQATEEEVSRFRNERYDFFRDQEYDEIVVITREGERKAMYGPIGKLGDARWYLLGTLMSRPGHPFTNYEIGSYNERLLNGLSREARKLKRKFVDSLYIRDNLIAGVHLLRKELFCDDATNSHFIVTRRPFTVAWHIDRSFLLISRNWEGGGK